MSILFDTDAPSLPHEVWPSRTLDERVCGSCTETHFYEDHVADLRWMRVRCDEKGCKCRDFTCYEHPDNVCSEPTSSGQDRD